MGIKNQTWSNYLHYLVCYYYWIKDLNLDSCFGLKARTDERTDINTKDHISRLCSTKCRQQKRRTVSTSTNVKTRRATLITGGGAQVGIITMRILCTQGHMISTHWCGWHGRYTRPIRQRAKKNQTKPRKSTYILPRRQPNYRKRLKYASVSYFFKSMFCLFVYRKGGEGRGWGVGSGRANASHSRNKQWMPGAVQTWDLLLDAQYPTE